MTINSNVIPKTVLVADLVDSVTTDVNSSDEIEVKNNLVNLLEDDTVGVILATSTTGFSPTKAQADYFSQAQGKESTINTTGGTGNTDATFSTNKYVASFYNQATENTAETLGSSGAAGAGGLFGFRITVGGTVCSLISVTNNAGSGATKAYVYTQAGELVDTATFSGTTATFATPVSLSASTQYYVVTGKDASDYTRTYRSGKSTPISGTYITYSSPAYGTYGNFAATKADGGDTFGLISMVVRSSVVATKRTVLSAALPGIDGSNTKIRLHAYNSTLATGNTITFDVDYTGDATWQKTNLAVDSYADLSGAQTFTNAKIRINLNKGTGTDGSAPELQGYCVMVV